MAHTFSCLRDHFLLSMPHLEDDTFAGTVVYLCDHNEYGAMGIVLNKPLNLSLAELLTHLELPCLSNNDLAIYAGGPVQPDRGFVLHRNYLDNPWLASYAVTDDITLTTSLDILEALAMHPSDDVLVALGCAGWGPGQLEKELADNLWLSCPANSSIMFGIPAKDKMQAAAALLGVNLNLMTAQVGHA